MTKFEQFAQSKGLSLDKDEQGNYLLNTTQIAWEAWNADKWVSTDDLPDEDGDYLVFRNNEKANMNTSSYATNYGFDCDHEFYSKEITHWQPLPQPPEEDYDR